MTKEAIKERILELNESLKPYEATIKIVEGIKKEVKDLKGKLKNAELKEMSPEEQYLRYKPTANYRFLSYLRNDCPLFYAKFVKPSDGNRYETIDIQDRWGDYLPWGFDEKSIQDYKEMMMSESHYFDCANDEEDVDVEFEEIRQICFELLKSKPKTVKWDW